MSHLGIGIFGISMFFIFNLSRSALYCSNVSFGPFNSVIHFQIRVESATENSGVEGVDSGHRKGFSPVKSHRSDLVKAHHQSLLSLVPMKRIDLIKEV